MKVSKGFTLLEVLVALAILTMGLLGLLHFFPVAHKLAKKSQDITTATMLAQQKIEEIREKSKSAWPANPCTTANWQAACGGTSSGDFDDPETAGIVEYANFEWEVAVDDVKDDVGALIQGGALQNVLCEVTVNVWWPAADGVPGNRTGQRSVELITNMAKY